MTVETAPEAEVTTASASETPVEGVDLDVTETPDGDDPGEATPEELEEVEYEGKKYKVAKPLKDGFLMRADYTRKTQEVAEQRKAVEARAKEFEAQQKSHQEYISDLGKLAAYDDAIKEFDKVDWAALFQGNRQMYDQLQFQRQQTIEARNKSFQSLQTKVAERNSKQQQESATQLEQFRRDVLEQVPEMAKPEYIAKLNAFGQSLGFTAEELGQVRDARIVKVLNAAYLGSQLQQQAAAAKKAKAAETVQPLPTATGNNSGNRIAPTNPASDKLSTDEWLKRRNADLKQRRAR